MLFDILHAYSCNSKHSTEFYFAVVLLITAASNVHFLEHQIVFALTLNGAFKSAGKLCLLRNVLVNYWQPRVAFHKVSTIYNVVFPLV